MDAATAFLLLNVSVLPWWAAWLIAPRAAFSRTLASHAAIFVLLSALYAIFMGTAIASGGPGGGFDFESLRAGLATPTGFLAGWIHYLCFDLFVGAWIVRESGRLGLEP